MWWIIFFIFVLLIIGVVIFSVKQNSLAQSKPNNSIGTNSSNNKNESVSKIVGKLLSDAEYHYDYEIVGESFYQTALNKIVGEKTEQSIELIKPAVIQRDINNVHDKFAVAIFIEGWKVGHLCREDAQEFCKLIKSKNFLDSDAFDVESMIVGGWKRQASEGKFGVRLNIPEDIDEIQVKRY